MSTPYPVGQRVQISFDPALKMIGAIGTVTSGPAFFNPSLHEPPTRTAIGRLRWASAKHLAHQKVLLDPKFQHLGIRPEGHWPVDWMLPLLDHDFEDRDTLLAFFNPRLRAHNASMRNSQ